MPVECAALVLARPRVGAEAQPKAIGERLLVLAAAPDGDPEPGLRLDVARAPEGQPPEGRVEPDRARARGGVDVAVGGDREPGPGLPAPPRPHDAKEPLDVGDDDRGRPAGQHRLEVPAGGRVLTLEEVRAGELEAHAHEPRPVEEDRPEGADRLAEEGLLLLGPGPRPLRSLQRREAPEEQDVGPVRAARRQRAEDLQRLVEAPGPDRLPRAPDRGVGREMGLIGRGEGREGARQHRRREGRGEEERKKERGASRPPFASSRTHAADWSPLVRRLGYGSW